MEDENMMNENTSSEVENNENIYSTVENNAYENISNEVENIVDESASGEMENNMNEVTSSVAENSEETFTEDNNTETNYEQESLSSDHINSGTIIDEVKKYNENIVRENQVVVSEEPLESKTLETDENPKSKKGILIAILVIIVALVCAAVALVLNKSENNNSTGTTNVNGKKYLSDYRMSGNSLEDFDLYFLKLENNKSNMIYSPLSIKYALEMLNEGADGDTKRQLSSIIGDYEARTYTNSKNMSFANALFVKNDIKDGIKQDYIDKIKGKFNAEVVFDAFETSDNINSWIKKNTLNLLDNLVDDVSDLNFALVNALAIDMEWVNKIQSEETTYSVEPKHEKFSAFVSSLDLSGYGVLDFDTSKGSKSVAIAAVANKYDIVSDIGEENIRKTVGEAYKKYLEEDPCETASEEPDVETYLGQYIKDINSNYKHVSSSTDFYFYDDDNVKSFAKDLKQYNGTTLQYIGIMPKTEKLSSYIENINVSSLNNLINNLKEIKLDSFKDGVITKITGEIPLFKFEYELNLMNDLKTLGVTDVFDSDKANLANLTTLKEYVSDVKHKANIEFSNDGIKATAATVVGGAGAGGCGFDYSYEVPVEEIDLTFNKPYMFIIRDKSTGEVWFVGTVYEPIEWSTEIAAKEQDKLYEEMEW